MLPARESWKSLNRYVARQPLAFVIIFGQRAFNPALQFPCPGFKPLTTR